MSEEAKTGPLTPDLCIIGATQGGLSLAAAAAAFGVPAVLVENGDKGDERLHADVRSQALIAAGQRVADMREANLFGIEARIAAIHHSGVMAHVKGAAASMAPNHSLARFEAMGVRVVRAAARFIDDRTVEAGGAQIKARRFVIAAGSTPAKPAIAGLDETPFLTSDTIFNLPERPDHLIVLGAGATGLELGQAFARLGSQVTILETKTALAGEDREMAGVVLDRLAREGVRLRENVAVESVGVSGGRVVVHPKSEHGEMIAGSHLLIATGRKPAIDGLQLDNAGIAFDETGVKVDSGLRASNKRVYAIGGCAAGQPAHAASDHASLVIRSALFRLPAKADASLVPRVVFTDPELAVCGLNETEARAAHRDAQTLRWPFAENDRGRADRAIDGHVKVVATQKGRILGVAIVGRRAGELMPMWSLAIAKGLKLKDIAGAAIHGRTLSEASKRAATSAFIPFARSAFARGAIAFLRRFG